MKYLVSLIALIPLASGAIRLTPSAGECPPKPATVMELDAAAVSTLYSYRSGIYV